MSNFSNFPSLPASLNPESKDWLISALDPFHDFEHPIEGAPDQVVSRSYTRKYTQSLTVSAAADDDNIEIQFYGFHGAKLNRFSEWGADYVCDPPDTSVSLAPITILSKNGAAWPTIGHYFAGTATKLGNMFTAHVDDVPSRLVSLGLEVNDVTPTLYRKGTVHANHLSGESEILNVGRFDATPVTPVHSSNLFIRKPTVPISATGLIQIPGAYMGPSSKGIYVAARLNEVQPPARGQITYPNGTLTGAHQPLVLLSEAWGSTTPAEHLYTQVSDSPMGMYFEENECGSAWRDSGFMPFVVGFSGLSAETVLQISVVTTTEYFPQVTHPFECGLATFSPVYDPEAFRVYHEVMRTLPSAVPVGMNAAGDYWRMVISAARKVVSVARRTAPYAGYALQGVGAAIENPLITMAGRALSSVPQKKKRPAVGPKKQK